MFDLSTLSPDDVKRINAPAAGSPCGCEECKRKRSISRLKDDIAAETYDTDGRKLDAAMDRMIDSVEAKASPAQPTDAEMRANPDDQVEHYERFE